MDRIVILHFSPLELYPPIQNLLSVLSETSKNGNIYVITTRASSVNLPPFNINSNRIKIVRYGKSGRILNSFIRYWNYIKFNGGALIELFTCMPTRVLYFETLSSLPAVVYKLIRGSSVKMYIHYHEYTSPTEYQAVKFMGFLHKCEKKILATAAWVSHTNNFRLKLFKEDVRPLQIRNWFVMPNYPPRSWHSPASPKKEHPVRIVYAGALSLSSMYTKEFAQWVVQQQGGVQWDIYAYNITPETKSYLQKLNADCIQVKAGVSYNEIPSILRQYSVGVILYKGHIPNYIYNAPNKLFEYMACGLSVWFPYDMIGSYEYVTENTYPEIVKLDFSKLEDYNVDTLIDCSNKQLKEFNFYCETSLQPLISRLIEQSDAINK